MAEEQRPQLRIDPQQFAQEVAAEIRADLNKTAGRNNTGRTPAASDAQSDEVSQQS